MRTKQAKAFCGFWKNSEKWTKWKDIIRYLSKVRVVCLIVFLLEINELISWIRMY
jgi:hypothetical protein